MNTTRRIAVYCGPYSATCLEGHARLVRLLGRVGTVDGLVFERWFVDFGDEYGAVARTVCLERDLLPGVPTS